MSEVARYGVKETMGARDALDICCEELRLLVSESKRMA